MHLQIFNVKSNESPLLCELESSEVFGVSLSIEAELEAELVNELGVHRLLIENWHHERPDFEVQNEVTEETEEECDNSRLQENQASIQGSCKCLLQVVPITKAEGLSRPQLANETM